MADDCVRIPAIHVPQFTPYPVTAGDEAADVPTPELEMTGNYDAGTGKAFDAPRALPSTH